MHGHLSRIRLSGLHETKICKSNLQGLTHMKKKLMYGLLGLAAPLMMSANASAQGLFEPAEGGWYASAFVGAGFPDDIAGIDLETGVFFGGSLGARLPFKSLGFVHTRLEAEVSYIPTGIEDDSLAALGAPAGADADFDVLFITANSYADLIWNENQALVPYIGGGLGIAISDATGFESETDFTTFQAIGLTLPINQLDLYTEGRYFTIYNEGPNADGFTWTAGLRWNF